MGKKRDKGEKDLESVPVKKSKKHKHKKSKRDLEEQIVTVDDLSEDVDVSVDDIDDEIPSAGLRLKIKISDNVSPDKSNMPGKAAKGKPEKNKSSNKKNNSRKKEGKGEDDTDSEEERWLHAIESGKLEEVDDELKRMKNPRLMTARQRALLEKRADVADDSFPVIPAEPLLALPSGFKEKVITEEMLAKKAIKSQKRREQAQEKREEDKKKTVDRLLRKQDPKLGRIGRLKTNRKDIPVFTYINNYEGVGISVPIGYSFPLEPQVKREKPEVVLCGVAGCPNAKIYNCSRTGTPLCSLECYKKNIIACSR